MNEPEDCPQCGESDFERFDSPPESLNTARDVPGKQCEECSFAVYNYGGDWEY